MISRIGFIGLNIGRKDRRYPKGASEAVDWRRTDNTMVKRKQWQTMIYNTLHITQKTKDGATWTSLKTGMNSCVQGKGGVTFLLHMWHRSCYYRYEWGRDGIVIWTNGTFVVICDPDIPKQNVLFFFKMLYFFFFNRFIIHVCS